MLFSLVDYSGLVVSAGTAGDASPRSSGKFIQVRNTDTEFLVISLTSETPYHANIAERFFGERGVCGSINRKRDNFSLADHEWEIVGGGSWELDSKERSLRFSGSSQAYGRFDPQDMRSLACAVPELAGFRIIID